MSHLPDTNKRLEVLVVWARVEGGTTEAMILMVLVVLSTVEKAVGLITLRRRRANGIGGVEEGSRRTRCRTEAVAARPLR